MNLTNSKSERPISGEVSVVEPEDMTTLFKPKRFENIKSGESEKIVFNIPEQLTGISGEFAFEIKTDDGEVKRVSDDTSFIAIEKIKKLPDIDGKISDGEWSAKSPIVLNSLTQVQQISNWGGTDDLSGVIYTGYNDKYFCLAAKVMCIMTTMTKTAFIRLTRFSSLSHRKRQRIQNEPNSVLRLWTENRRLSDTVMPAAFRLWVFPIRRSNMTLTSLSIPNMR